MTIHDLNKPAINLFEEGVFPSEWRLVPLLGKAPKIKDWPSSDYRGKEFIKAYWSRQHSGIGVLTGAPSGGLIALDIDGPAADARLQAALGEAYEPAGKESSMSWTSGKAGRRQVLYKVPEGMTTLLSKVVKLALDPATGKWGKAPDKDGGDEKYEEVVLRFNRCQSVLPGSAHPETKKKYRFLNYNEGVVSKAPDWMVDILMEHTSPDIFVEQKWQAEAEDKVGNYITTLPDSQMRGWLFREDGGFGKLRDRLQDLVFNHEVHDRYGWEPKDDGSCQMVSGCPWHGGESGTAFQMRMDTGVWICHGCGVGGDLIDYIHKINTGDKHAPKPTGPDLEAIIGKLATDLGEKWPECALPTQKVVQEAKPRISEKTFFETCDRIIRAEENVALRHQQLVSYAAAEGYHGYATDRNLSTGEGIEKATQAYVEFKEVEGQPAVSEDVDWIENALAKRDFLIPDFIQKPNMIMLHAPGGKGKTRIAIALAKIVGRGLTMKVRETEVKPRGNGKVLFIGSDMSRSGYAEYFAQQDISQRTDPWLVFQDNWKQDQTSRMIKWINHYQPSLVVIDSLTSVSQGTGRKEIESDYSKGLYDLQRANGRDFPNTCFLVIHHNKKDAPGFRGSDTLNNAVDERWELVEPSEEELVKYGPQALVMVISKSRNQRDGDRVLVSTDVDERITITDLTPEERWFKGTQTVQPKTMVLGLLRQAPEGLTISEIHDGISARQVGAGEKVPNRKSVERWVQFWESQTLIADSGETRVNETRGKPAKIYLHTASPSWRAQNVHKSPPSIERTPCYDRGDLWTNNGHPPEGVHKPETPEIDRGIMDTQGLTEGECPLFVHNSSQSPQSSHAIEEGDLTTFQAKADPETDPYASIPILPISVLSETDETEGEVHKPESHETFVEIEEGD
jgi:hypothetical protein